MKSVATLLAQWPAASMCMPQLGSRLTQGGGILMDVLSGLVLGAFFMIRTEAVTEIPLYVSIVVIFGSYHD
eukprot:COSAG01_NODE_13110_length_1634_cov_1.117264_1_plen_70_part_10